MLPPDQFIPLAEKSGLIVQVGHWVLDRACCQMAVWKTSNQSHWTVAVNLSAQQFSDPGLVEVVRETLARYDLDARHLILEITESTAMRSVDHSVEVLEQLSDIGVGISIDDFGTGYSSLLHLKRMPANELKIDRGFVRDLIHDSDDAAIIAAVVALGHTLKMQIVAEGVETDEQVQFLTQLGCNCLQGFLLGRPVAADQLHNLLVDSGRLPDPLLIPAGV